MLKTLMGSTSLTNRIAFAPPDLGGGGEPDYDTGADGFGNAEQDMAEFEDDYANSFQDDPNQQNDEITLDEGDALARLFNSNPNGQQRPQSGNNDSQQSNQQQQQQQQQTNQDGPTADQLAEQMEAAITGFAFDEDLIPENFNPNDSRQLRDVLTNAMQLGIRQSLAVMFNPVQATMNQMSRNLRTEMQTLVDSSNSSRDQNTELSRAIPAWNDPAQRAVIQPLFEQARRVHGTDLKASVKATRDAMVALGMNPAGRKTSGPRQAIQSNNDVLNDFAPLPQLPRVRPAQQVRRSMKSGQ